MDTEKLNKLEKTIKNLEEKSSILYFFVQDTNGNAKGGVRYIYQIALTLFNNGYNVIIIHEKNNYKGVGDWLGPEYGEIPHESIENQSLRISPEDFVIIPEIFGYIIEQITNLPCGKVVLCQSYDNIFETLKPGMTWADFGFFKCITTTNEQKNYIESIMRNVTLDVIEPYIPTNFSKKPKPSKPIIGIHTREQRDSINLIKQFYLKYPQYRFFTFRDLRGLSQEEFAQALQDTFLGVWIDPTSGFGTFPLECMKSGVVTLGKVPNLKPEWMNDKNGIWLEDQLIMVDVIADIIQTWLEDSLVEELYVEGEKTASKYSDQETFKSQVLELFSDFSNKRQEAFEAQLNPEISK
jgi:hypothetical protein